MLNLHKTKSIHRVQGILDLLSLGIKGDYIIVSLLNSSVNLCVSIVHTTVRPINGQLVALLFYDNVFGHKLLHSIIELNLGSFSGVVSVASLSGFL